MLQVLIFGSFEKTCQGTVLSGLQPLHSMWVVKAHEAAVKFLAAAPQSSIRPA